MKALAVAGLVLSLSGTSAWALEPVASSLRPEVRPVEGVQVASLSLPVRPKARPASRDVVETAGQAGFDRWVRQFRTRAEAQGIRRSVLDQAFKGVRYDPDVIKRDKNQSEFTKTIWDYLDTAVSDTRIANGKKALAREGAVLNRIEQRYGVDKEVVVAIWGLESAYGSFRGSNSTIGSLATLAYGSRRSDFFEDELIGALKILQSGDTTPAKMKGSWAGAMGHTQFMPSSYHALAVDFTGDGKRDIWSDDPTDALASTAAYLKHHGWIKGQPWGVEVRIPDGFDYLQANRETLKMPSDWAAMGVVGVDGKPVRDHGAASVLLPAGADGAAFMIFKNFDVIERYNTADAYVIAVGHLADRIKGGRAIQSKWPRGDRALTYAERTEMQRRLTAKGFDTVKVDGKIGPLTINAVRRFQQSRGMKPDGYASLRILQALR
ncbi:lytic murein transglycosylase [Thalassococcus halodurans]|uniref:Lytic murein transglycosylase n=1 Tax=Thalassococcus halodurans TaxID=373675 RepID=A0A1H6BX35_9RHOB|nr:lytic murein transglycosylase [Thalassococcus halodurans]SEG65258.1 lytic murein transglycosylase [Thalassococcus halodurans]